ncbi:MAG: VOC family protein [Deltaproteobacteria bacterium]|nr:VOC family protein [Deltaproteobacteria bacterium]
MIGLHIQGGGEIQRGNEPLVTFHIDSDIEKFYDVLKKHGVKLLGKIAEEPIGKVVSFEDPDGYVLSLHEPKR